MSYADEHAPRGIIVDGKVTNHAQLKRYWDAYNERRGRMRRMMFQDMRDEEPPVTKPQEIVHVVRHSEMSKQESDMLQQLSREVKYLRNQVKELSEKKNVKKRVFNKYEI